MRGSVAGVLLLALSASCARHDHPRTGVQPNHVAAQVEDPDPDATFNARTVDVPAPPRQPRQPPPPPRL